MAHASELAEALLQSAAHHIRHPEMQRTGYYSRRIRHFRQVVAQLGVYEVRHSLCRCRLLHVAVYPAVVFKSLLEVHHLQHVVAFYIFGAHLNHHAAVRPLRASVARTHAVHHNLLLVGSGRNDEAARTHAEGINSSAVNLRHEAVLCRRQILASALLAVVLYLVYQLRRMLKSHTHRNALSLKLHSCGMKIAVDIACRMARGKDYRSAEGALRPTLLLHSLYAPFCRREQGLSSWSGNVLRRHIQ